MVDLSHTDPKTPFRASRIKIDRARAHLAELETVVEAYVASEPAKFSGSIEGDRISVTMERLEGPPDVICAIVGDIVHNLRASLDLLACELCRINSKSDEGVYFPFCEKESELDAMIVRRGFDRAGDAAIRLLREYKPYRGGNVALRGIHDLDIQDKHQALILGAAGVGSPIFKINAPGDGPLFEFVSDPEKPSELKLIFMKDSIFADRELAPTLKELVEMTAGIIEAFKALSAPTG